MILEGLILSIFLFGLGFITFLLRRNLILMFLGIELILNSANLAFVVFSAKNQNWEGALFVLFSIGIAAAEAAVGLAIFISAYRSFKTSYIDFFKILRF
jgi:NADH-quinone oxidoreductase subunit K